MQDLAIAHSSRKATRRCCRLARIASLPCPLLRQTKSLVPPQPLKCRFGISCGAFQDELGDAERINPHRHVSPAALLDPPGVRRQFGAATGALRQNEIAIAKGHGDRDGDVTSSCEWRTCVQERLFERG